MVRTPGASWLPPPTQPPIAPSSQVFIRKLKVPKAAPGSTSSLLTPTRPSMIKRTKSSTTPAPKLGGSITLISEARSRSRLSCLRLLASTRLHSDFFKLAMEAE
ncbi:hypothetical protein PS2_022138 [Malus domestica]